MSQAEVERLSDREQKLLVRLLSDPLSYPQPLKQWIISYLEGSEIVLPMQSVSGLQEILGDLGNLGPISDQITALTARVTALEQDNLCLAYAQTGIAVPANVWTTNQFQAIQTQVGAACFNVGQFAPFTGRMRCMNKGTYAITARVAFSPAQQATGERGIWVSCPQHPEFGPIVGGPTVKTQAATYMVSFEIALNVDDYFSLAVTSDVATSIDTAANAAWLSAVLIRG